MTTSTVPASAASTAYCGPTTHSAPTRSRRGSRRHERRSHTDRGADGTERVGRAHEHRARRIPHRVDDRRREVLDHVRGDRDGSVGTRRRDRRCCDERDGHGDGAHPEHDARVPRGAPALRAAWSTRSRSSTARRPPRSSARGTATGRRRHVSWRTTTRQGARERGRRATPPIGRVGGRRRTRPRRGGRARSGRSTAGPAHRTRNRDARDR